MNGSRKHLALLHILQWVVIFLSFVSVGPMLDYCQKFHHFGTENKVAFIMTDTKTCWGEVLNLHQISVRWKACNPNAQPVAFHEDQAWAESIIILLSHAHTLGAFIQASIDVQDSTYSDLQTTLSYDTFTWSWHLSSLGSKISSELLSKHLIIPLINLNHLAFVSTTLPNQLSSEDLQNNIDKIGRTAKRALGTHIKNALAKPQIATGLARFTSLVQGHPETTCIKLSLDSPELELPEARPIQASVPSQSATATAEKGTEPFVPVEDEAMPEAPPLPSSSKPNASDSDSDSDVEPLFQDEEEMSGGVPSKSTKAPQTADVPMDAQSDDESPKSPTRKLVKRNRSDFGSDEEYHGGSEEKEKKRAPSEKPKAKPTNEPVKRGTRQPLKRGGKRF
ncbi:hypothetical protein DL96DRAFT_1587037 [Flagelloscypha sp. PMI_526]|nr:hypothetical protein DL96DRAFT_1587037 [Flagelloscypha sp. PMI_526]